MTMISEIRELNIDELNCVVGGSHFQVGESWSPPTLAGPPVVNVSGVQPIHLAPLPPLHVAVPHF
jgi:bacteriocin-like protein